MAAALLWAGWASVTYDLHKCEWVSRVGPSVFGVILLRSKIFYCAHSRQHLPPWWGDVPILAASCSLLWPRFQWSHFQTSVWDPEDHLCFFRATAQVRLWGCCPEKVAASTERLFITAKLWVLFSLPELQGICKKAITWTRERGCVLEGALQAAESSRSVSILCHPDIPR